jgi:hypothetical protein
VVGTSPLRDVLRDVLREVDPTLPRDGSDSIATNERVGQSGIHQNRKAIASG